MSPKLQICSSHTASADDGHLHDGHHDVNVHVQCVLLSWGGEAICLSSVITKKKLGTAKFPSFVGRH